MCSSDLGVLEDQHLTVSAIKWSGKAGEDEWRRGGARRLGRPRGRERMVRENGGVSVRFLARGWRRRRCGAPGSTSLSSGTAGTTARCGDRGGNGGARLGLGKRESAEGEGERRRARRVGVSSLSTRGEGGPAARRRGGGRHGDGRGMARQCIPCSDREDDFSRKPPRP